MHPEEEKRYVIVGMRKYGGGFMYNLASALEFADPNNTRKIKETWPDAWRRYSEQGKRVIKEGGKNEQNNRS